MRRRQAGFSLLELMVAAAILSVFAAALLNRLVYYQELAEKTHMEATVRVLQSGLRFEMARMLMAGREIDHDGLARQNPMDWLEKKPPNYLGEYRQGGAGLTRGAWYFDSDRHELVYLPRLERHFVPDSTGLCRVRYRVERLTDKGTGGVTTLRLREVEPYRWLVE